MACSYVRDFAQNRGEKRSFAGGKRVFCLDLLPFIAYNDSFAGSMAGLCFLRKIVIAVFVQKMTREIAIAVFVQKMTRKIVIAVFVQKMHLYTENMVHNNYMSIIYQYIALF